MRLAPCPWSSEWLRRQLQRAKSLEGLQHTAWVALHPVSDSAGLGWDRGLAFLTNAQVTLKLLLGDPHFGTTATEAS